MKYIDADKIKNEIERLKHEWTPLFKGGTKLQRHLYFDAFDQILLFVERIQQELPMPPGIVEESQKKGWLDYGLTMNEIGLHRYNAINRIREHKEKFNALAIQDIYHVAEYYESVGIEKTCCCLQRYCMDFRFDQEEVGEIIIKEISKKSIDNDTTRTTK